MRPDRDLRWLPWLFGGLWLGLTMLCSLFLLALLGIIVTFNAFLFWEFSDSDLLLQQPAEPTAGMVAAAPAAVRLSPTVIPLPTPPSIPSDPTPIPHLMTDYTIEGLRGRSYPGGTIQIRRLLTATTVFTSYYIHYPSDGLTITGVMQVPRGEGPFPVIILNHGYIARHQYWPGADTWRAAAFLNRRGYLTIAPDFRSWGDSDTGNSFFRTGQVIDTLNLVSSLPSLAQADTGRVGMWGHSMGGGVTTKAITVDPRIKAAVLYAPLSAYDSEVLARWGPGCVPARGPQLAEACSGEEILVNNIDQNLYLAYADALYNPLLLYEISPINHFEAVTAPVQIHIGEADTVTPPEWSTAIYDTLRAAGKPVELYTYPDQGHALQG
ncbi:MAG: alpha/beta fold hydrolase, partial [Anaerolineae bacterium]|nr:alpha/beta fold hydrolase [Anaerolineae bacterium]